MYMKKTSLRESNLHIENNNKAAIKPSALILQKLFLQIPPSPPSSSYCHNLHPCAAVPSYGHNLPNLSTAKLKIASNLLPFLSSQMHTCSESLFLTNNSFSAISWPILMPNTANWGFLGSSSLFLTKK